MTIMVLEHQLILYQQLAARESQTGPIHSYINSLTRLHFLFIPKAISPTQDLKFKYMSFWDYSHSNNHTFLAPVYVCQARALYSA